MPPAAIPEFSWTSIEDSQQYRSQLSQDIGFVNKIEYLTRLTTFSPALCGHNLMMVYGIGG